jgi:hypothetical protein
MQQVTVNYLAVIAAAVVHMAIGFTWYGPLYGKEWMRLVGMTPEKMEEAKKKGMGKTYALGFLTSLVMAYVMAHIVRYAEASTFQEGMQGGFWVWLGFVATVTMGPILWEGKPWKLWYLNAGYYLAALLVMGGILTVWA